MRLPIQLGIPVLLCGAALAQSQPNAAAIVKRVSETYKAASEYEFVADTTETDPATGKREIGHTVVALKLPDRYRIEGRPSDGDKGKAWKTTDIILDGKTIWFYDPQFNQYASYPASVIGEDLPDEFEVSGMDYFVMARYRTAVDYSATAKFLREDPIEIGGANFGCYVVSVRERNTEFTWWVDKTSNHVVREDTDSSSATFTTIKMGESLPDSLFKFDAPPGARKNQPDLH